MKCAYMGCKNKKKIGSYCWKHNPYLGMFDPREEKKRVEHYRRLKINAIDNTKPYSKIPMNWEELAKEIRDIKTKLKEIIQLISR